MEILHILVTILLFAFALLCCNGMYKSTVIFFDSSESYMMREGAMFTSMFLGFLVVILTLLGIYSTTQLF